MTSRLMDWPRRAFSISEEGIPAGAVVACRTFCLMLDMFFL